MFEAMGDAAILRLQQDPGVFPDGRPQSYAMGLMVGTHKGLPEVAHSGSTAGSVDGDALVIKRRPDTVIRLRPAGRDEFDSPAGRIVFIRANGAVTELSPRLARVRHPLQKAVNVVRHLILTALVAASGCVEAPERPVQAPAASTVSNRGPELRTRLEQIASRTGGTFAVSVVNIETGETASLNADRALPLYSVFKLPVAVAVLKDAGDRKLSLDERIRVTPREASPGAQTNSALWRVATNRTIREMLELSLVRSDNTSVDKLIDRLGGAAEVTRRLSAMGVDGIQIEKPVRDFLGKPGRPNTASAEALTRMLVRLHKGELLKEAERTLLLGMMSRQMTGDRRFKAGVPAGAVVAAKTGTGPGTTNEAGLIALPGGAHLAIAVLIDGSPLSPAEEEAAIASVARAACEIFAKR